MDIDQMGGSTLQAMADAVEGADVVLICMSNKYKNSPNCRAGKCLLVLSLSKILNKFEYWSFCSEPQTVEIRDAGPWVPSYKPQHNVITQ